MAVVLRGETSPDVDYDRDTGYMLIFKIHFHRINVFEHVILINYNRWVFFIDNVKRKHVIVTALDTS